MSSALLEQGVFSGEEGMRQYLQEIRKFPLLTPEEERELARKQFVGIYRRLLVEALAE